MQEYYYIIAEGYYDWYSSHTSHGTIVIIYKENRTN
jgi:hypothetical protein